MVDKTILSGANIENALPSNFNWASGKSAFMGSFNEYLVKHIKGEYFDFDNPILPVKLPGYGVTEKGLYSLGAVAFEHFLGYNNGLPLYGRKNQTLIEVSAWDDETTHPNAVGKVREMRDKIVYMLYNAGRVDDSGAFVLPPIKMFNYNVNPKVETGKIELDPSDNSINEKFLVDPVSQNIKIYKLLVRMNWFEYL